jgi:hypothetical protein
VPAVTVTPKARPNLRRRASLGNLTAKAFSKLLHCAELVQAPGSCTQLHADPYGTLGPPHWLKLAATPIGKPREIVLPNSQSKFLMPHLPHATPATEQAIGSRFLGAKSSWMLIPADKRPARLKNWIVQPNGADTEMVLCCA